MAALFPLDKSLNQKRSHVTLAHLIVTSATMCCVCWRLLNAGAVALDERFQLLASYRLSLGHCASVFLHTFEHDFMFDSA